MDLFTAINSPGTGARMRRALKVLAKEWRRRGVPCQPDPFDPCDGCEGCDECLSAHRYLTLNMPPSLLQRQLKKLGACKPSIKWAGQFSTAREAWEACEQEGWMRWIVRAYGGRELAADMANAGVGVCNSPEALAAQRRVVPFERLRELSRGK